MKNRIQTLLDNFNSLQSWEDRYKSIIKKGKALTPLDEKFKTDDYVVKGCQSKVWIYAELNSDGQVIIQADSDALIVKGLVAVLLEVYSGATPDEILSTPPDFIKDLGFEGNLSPNRANGLYAMLRQIIYYATAFKFKGNVE